MSYFQVKIHLYFTLIDLVCQYIATTKLKFFEKADAQDHNTEMMQDAVNLTREIQQPEKEEKKNKFVTGDARRRQTVANLQGYHKKVQREGQDLNLEKQFKKNLEQLGKFNQIINSKI